jgi:hypothetical protein
MKRHRIQVFHESYTAPTWAAAILTQSGGLNIYGEPFYRAVWSNNRFAWCAGKWEDRDTEGYLVREVLAARLVPKYPVRDRWIIEQWLPAEKYGSRENWWRDTREWGEEGNLPQLGPYPSRGDYELACLIETRDRQFVQLEPYIIEDFFWQLKLAKMRSYAEGVRQAKEKQEQEKRRFLKQSHELLNEETMPVANDSMMVTVL